MHILWWLIAGIVAIYGYAVVNTFFELQSDPKVKDGSIGMIVVLSFLIPLALVLLFLQVYLHPKK